MALTAQSFFTVAEYVYLNALAHQIPPSAYRACSDHLRLYCMDQAIPFRKQPVGGKKWEDEHAFPGNVFELLLPGWIARRAAQVKIITE